MYYGRCDGMYYGMYYYRYYGIYTIKCYALLQLRKDLVVRNPLQLELEPLVLKGLLDEVEVREPIRYDIL